MKLKLVDKILLIMIGLFLILSSVLTTYVVMSYISFKNNLENTPPDIIIDDNPEAKDKTPLDMNELNSFSTYFNDELTGTFLSAVSFNNLSDLSLTSSNLQQYVYPKMNNVTPNGTTSTMTLEDFITNFYNLTGLTLKEDDITDKPLYNKETGLITFTPSAREMNASVQIISSYKVKDIYYFDIAIDNTIYGAMKRSLALIKNNDKYKFIYLKSTID